MSCSSRTIALLVLALTACGHSDGATPSDAAAPPVDATAEASGGGDDAAVVDAEAAAPPRLGVTETTVYAGTNAAPTAQVIGSDAGLTFAWNVVSAPPGSGVTSASIVGATTLAPAIPTDVAGTYTLSVSATSDGSVVASAQTTVTAVPAEVIYVRTEIDTGGGNLALIAVGHDGSGSHAVACPSNFYSNQTQLAQQRTMLSGASLLDVWEGAPGQPSKYALAGVTTLTADDAGDYAISLVAGTSTTSCATAPAALATVTAPVGALGQPRFSPDGSRVAFLEPLSAGASYGVATIAFDGTTRRSIAPFYPGGAPADGGADESSNVRLEWRDASTVAWPQSQANGTWRLVTAADAAGATPQTLFSCGGATTPHHVGFLADGTVIAAFSPSAGAPVDLFVLGTDSAGGCTVVHNLTHLSGPWSRAHDFAVSPDGKTVAFLRYDSVNDAGDPNNEGVLSLVPVDGSAAPVSVGAPTVGRIGPRWIGAGSRLSWTRADGASAYANAVAVVQPDGGDARDLDVGDGGGAIVASAGPGGSCAMAPGRARSSGAIVAAMLGLLMLGVARRTKSRA